MRGAKAANAKPLVFSGQILALQIVFAIVVGDAAGALRLIDPSQSDFAMFWAAHRVATPYDPAAISAALTHVKAYFPYAPPFLLLTAPLALVSASVGYLAWVGLSAAAVVASLRRLAAPVVLLVPMVFLSGLIGQTSLIMGACLYGGASLRQRPILAGALLGVAACIKPQVVVLLPFVLIGAGRWRVMASAAITGLLLCAAATAVYGVGIWSDWLGSLPGFLKANDIAWTGRYLALPGAWKLVALAVGAAAAWWAGRRDRVELGVFIAIAAALLGSLHAMDYDAAILAPFAVSAALARRWWGLPYAVALLVPASPWSVLALGAMAAADMLAAAPGDPETDRGQGVPA